MTKLGSELRRKGLRTILRSLLLQDWIDYEVQSTMTEEQLHMNQV